MNKHSKWLGATLITAILVPSAIFVDGQDAALLKELRAAKTELQAGINAWGAEHLLAARDMFIGCLLKQKEPTPFFFYYAALADYRLASFYLASEATAEADRYIAEGEKYLEKAMDADSGLGEVSSLYGFLLGIEVALHQERALSLGPTSLSWMNDGIGKEPNNPRTHLMKGMYLLYVPEVFGGGPANALPSLEKALELFETETVRDPVKPSWGRDEALAYTGMAWRLSGDLAKAREFFKKALAVNPDLSYARMLLAEIDKNR